VNQYIFTDRDGRCIGCVGVVAHRCRCADPCYTQVTLRRLHPGVAHLSNGAPTMPNPYHEVAASPPSEHNASARKHSAPPWNSQKLQCLVGPGDVCSWQCVRLLKSVFGWSRRRLTCRLRSSDWQVPLVIARLPICVDAAAGMHAWVQLTFAGATLSATGLRQLCTGTDQLVHVAQRRCKWGSGGES
jgi:hypothetical protein